MDKANWKFKTGLVLVIFSTIIFAFLIFIPLLNTTNKNKIFITTVTVVVGEVLFWTGGLLLGQQMFDKYKSYLNPTNWFNRKNKNNS
jgi:uncharacterized membrane protein